MFQVVDRFVSVIETIGMPQYRNIEDLRRYAEIVLCKDAEEVGDNLFLSHRR